MSARHPNLSAVRRLFRSIPALALGACAVSFSGAAAAQTYPAAPIRLIVPYTPGTGPDTIARTMSERLAKRLGQPVVVENRAGASGNIGADAVAKARPDGYTLLMTASTMITAALLYRSVPFDPLADFAPVSLVSHGTLMLAASARSDIGSVADLVRAAKAHPGGVRYSSPGVGTPHHMSMELLQDVAGIKLQHIPYKGTAGAVTDLMGGQVDVSFLGLSVGIPAAEAGRVKALAVGSPARHPRLPNLPTLEEAGVKGAGGDMWFAVLAPKGVPEAIVARLNAELRAVLAESGIKGVLDAQGLDVATSSPAELAELMKRDTVRWAEVIRNNRISLD